ncbi:MAG: Mrp/NBP35 family ATP-binding protein [Candidatus Omnitrophica bacterium]|nr:Mrp/NBP35 family ATP-binding protein [Candidatus Omnitrophota bacterium]MBU4590512.1 Mrp/NBP35 family ATP-binding protein [Candidatus Omnitrophota bacterium]
MEDTERKQKELEQEERLKSNLSRIKNKLLIISGKGGVGKTTVAVNLAYGLAIKGYKTGVLDVDIHGPNIAKMLGIEDKKLVSSESGIEPVMVLSNLKAISLALVGYDVNQPVIWRGPLKMIAIKQLLSDVNWGELDYLIIDSPPGTGDEPLSVCQLIPDLNGAIVVTTPQDVAILDSKKSVLFAVQLNVPVLGIIENMSGFVCPHCGKEVDLFGMGGGEKAAENLKVPFLGRIPLEPLMIKSGDSGKPFIHFNKDRNTAKILDEITEKILRKEKAK